MKLNEVEVTVRAARQISGMSQAEMAKLLRMHRTTYNALEQEPDRFTIQQARQFCRALGLSLEQVFGKGGKAP